MLSDILGTLIGFVTVMLILSLVITGLVQATQSMFRLRARNLEQGLTAVWQDVSGGERSDAKADARLVLNTQTTAVLGKYHKSEGVMSLLFGPAISWLDPEQLRQSLLEDCPLPMDEDKAQRIKTRFEKIEAPLQTRFRRTIRLWTIFWSLVIAVYFQISAPSLLNDLWNDAALRAQATEMAPQVLADTQRTLTELARYDDVSGEALQRLTERYPEVAERIEEASGMGASRASLQSELALVLQDDPRKPQIIGDYAQLLDELYREQGDTARATTQAATLQLSRLDLTPWPHGWGYYFDARCRPRAAHWVGVLMTMVLLSFGAPFWFGNLQKLINLRDALQPKPPTPPPAGEPATAPNATVNVSERPENNAAETSRPPADG